MKKIVRILIRMIVAVLIWSMAYYTLCALLRLDAHDLSGFYGFAGIALCGELLMTLIKKITDKKTEKEEGDE